MTVSARMEARALANAALMRDQKIVFYGVQSVLNGDGTDDIKLAKIGEYYDAFAEAHPT